MRIGELARETGTKVETIRFYEAEGLIPTPPRTGGNYRDYDRLHLDRLSFIRRSRDLGFTLDQVRVLLRLADNERLPCGEVDAIAGDQLQQVERKIADLQALRKELAGMVNQCKKGTVADCRILDALRPVQSGARRRQERYSR